TMKKTEFLIVGNGLAGTLLAFEMLKNKLDFKIVASPSKNRASEIATGMYNPLVFKRLTKSWMADELLPVMQGKITELEQLLGEKFLFRKDILKPLSEQEKELWQVRKQEAEFSKYIREIVGKSPVKNVVPAAGYGRVSGSGYVDLKKFLKAADQFFFKKELLIRTHFDPGIIDPSTEYFEVDNLRAKKIVFCGGAALKDNPLFSFIKLVPVKGEVLQLFSTEIPENYILNKNVFLLPLGNHRFKAGSTYEWKDLTSEPTETGKQSILQRLEKLISAEYTIENHWAGIRPATSDRRPVLGIHPKNNQVSVFNGLGTKGVMLAPFFANEMLKLLTIQHYSANREVDINRFL
ncbi:MAG: NAD(P)/FAD-dependent oxidoreductase, partial [Bacteroidota bacterium]